MCSYLLDAKLPLQELSFSTVGNAIQTASFLVLFDQQMHLLSKAVCQMLRHEIGLFDGVFLCF